MTPHPPPALSSILNFDNRFTRCLPGDSEPGNFRRQVQGACYSRVLPTPVKAPETLAVSGEAAQLLDLDEQDCGSREFTQVFSGNRVLPAMDPFAMCYGGHQFGNWAGQLGDGRAINLGEVVNAAGERWMIQLKGAGPTPYSRTADGLAVLRSSIREFLCSEAMFHLGIPTTRALSLTTTGQPVERDMFYDGHPREEPGAVVCRLAPSFTRFGNFEILAARGETALLRQLMDYTIETDFPHLAPKDYTSWFMEISRRTMEMVVHWMRTGFVHGVMNTDNMSVLGLTIDFGPYGWLDDYNPLWTPNTTDLPGRRYCFQNQPRIALWNLGRLAGAILPVTGSPGPLQEILDDTVKEFTHTHRNMLAAKLGLNRHDPAADAELVSSLFALLTAVETDYTLFFRGLSRFDPAKDTDPATLPDWLSPALYRPEQAGPDYLDRLGQWLKIYGLRLKEEGRPPEERKKEMDRVNPKYILRNYLSQQAIDKAEKGDFSRIHELLELVRRPYDEQPDKEKFAARRPEWARNKPGCSMLSCSS
ncbi:MAG: YdiU family protein [Desulfobacter sp.]|nr:MAG: YdiU family protein [Desulfobacter sp.]